MPLDQQSKATHSRTDELKVELDALHSRILGGSAEALEAFCRCVSIELNRQFGASQGDPHLAQMAIDDALVKYSANPRCYDPSRGHPVALLKKIAKDALIDHQRVRTRHMAREVAVGVDLGVVENRVAVGEEVAAIQARDRERELVIATGKTRLDQSFLRAWLQGASEAALAKILGIKERSVDRRRARIGRAKERLRLAAKRLLRLDP